MKKSFFARSRFLRIFLAVLFLFTLFPNGAAASSEAFTGISKQDFEKSLGTSISDQEWMSITKNGQHPVIGAASETTDIHLRSVASQDESSTSFVSRRNWEVRLRSFASYAPYFHTVHVTSVLYCPNPFGFPGFTNMDGVVTIKGPNVFVGDTIGVSTSPSYTISSVNLLQSNGFTSGRTCNCEVGGRALGVNIVGSGEAAEKHLIFRHPHIP